MAAVQAQVRQRVLRAFVRRSLLDQHDGDQIGGWAHGGGFSLDDSVRIEGADRLVGNGCCATAPARRSPSTIYRNTTPNIWSTSSPSRVRTGPRALLLTPLELIDQVAALVPPPRVHRHRYYGVLA